MYGPEGIHFYTRAKVVTTRWPDPATSDGRPRLPREPVSRAVDIGVVLQNDPAGGAVVELAAAGRGCYGFSHVWTFDSHILLAGAVRRSTARSSPHTAGRRWSARWSPTRPPATGR